MKTLCPLSVSSGLTPGAMRKALFLGRMHEIPPGRDGSTALVSVTEEEEERRALDKYPAPLFCVSLPPDTNATFIRGNGKDETQAPHNTRLHPQTVERTPSFTHFVFGHFRSLFASFGHFYTHFLRTGSSPSSCPHLERTLDFLWGRHPQSCHPKPHSRQ